jgi:hypothetical protein
MTNTVKDFFSGGGRKTVKFPVEKPGTTFEGVIAAVHEPELQTDFESRQPIEGKYQMRIDLDTDARDPADPDDDGKYTLYVKGWMQGAIGEALRNAGATAPQAGAKLKVTYTHTGAPSRPGLSGPKQYTAVYTPGFFAAANGSAETSTSAPESTNAPVPSEPPKGIDAGAWASMPPEVKQAVANAAAAQPPF